MGPTDSEQTLTPGYEHIHGMTLGDVDGDGALDAFMAGAPNQIWLNDGAGAFGEDMQSLPGLAGDSVAFGDLDGDGDLDAYLAVGDWTGSHDKVWLNDGGVQGGTPGRFTDSGLPLSAEFSSGIGLGDLDGDGDLDAFVVHGELGRDGGGGIPNEVWLNETIAPTSEAPPPLSGSGGGMIAFASERDGRLAIHVMNADGVEQGSRDQRKLTDFADMEAYPDWSPDGKQIAFHAHHGSRVWSIYVINADGVEQGSRNRRRLTDSETRDAAPVWSPDGAQIAFSRDGDVWVMNADGSDQRQLTTDPSNDSFTDWSPDGKQIVFCSERDGNWEVYVMAADGTDQQRLTDNDADDWWPDWSPDNSQIAFKTNRDDNFEIYVMNADGTSQRRLTDNLAEDGEPDWSPDGTQIAFESNRDGNFEIYVMNADGTDPRRLTDHPARDIMPAWRPVATVTSSPEPQILGDTWTRPADGMAMVYVPGGEFQMGSSDAEVDAALEMCSTYYSGCERGWFEVEQPVHTVVLDGFWIDQTEVTNGQYQRCVEAGACDPPRETSSDTRSTYYGDSAYDDYPVVNVDWHQADSYCAWAGGRLPKEAEWG